MDRKEFLQKSLKLGVCCSGALASIGSGTKLALVEETHTVQDARLKYQKDFVENWLSDLLAAVEKELDKETQVKLIEGCGKECFRRHKFKTDIAERGKGGIDKLIEAMKSRWEVWKEGNDVHVRFGEKIENCRCPVLNSHPYKPDDIHCNCSKATQQAIFETALGRPVKVDILESIRRGGQTCHFLVHL